MESEQSRTVQSAVRMRLEDGGEESQSGPCKKGAQRCCSARTATVHMLAKVTYVGSSMVSESLNSKETVKDYLPCSIAQHKVV